MYYNEITEEMWDKIEAEGIVVLKSSTDEVNFVINYRFYAEDKWFPHIGDELDSDLIGRLETGEGWGKSWSVVKSPMRQSTFTDRSVSKDPVVDWLEKLHYVFSSDNSIGRIDVGTTCLFITTDYGDISGTQQVLEFINNRYELLQKEVKSNKQKELAEKKAKLLEELSVIDKEMEWL